MGCEIDLHLQGGDVVPRCQHIFVFQKPRGALTAASKLSCSFGCHCKWMYVRGLWVGESCRQRGMEMAGRLHAKIVDRAYARAELYPQLHVETFDFFFASGRERVVGPSTTGQPGIHKFLSSLHTCDLVEKRLG